MSVSIEKGVGGYLTIDSASLSNTRSNYILTVRVILILGLFLIGVYKSYGMLFFPYLFTYATQGLLIVVVLDIIWSGLRGEFKISRNYRYGLLSLLGFYWLIIVSLFYSPSPEFKFVKALNFIIPIVFFGYAPLLKKISFERLIYPYILLLLPLVVLVVSFQNAMMNFEMSFLF